MPESDSRSARAEREFLFCYEQIGLGTFNANSKPYRMPLAGIPYSTEQSYQGAINVERF